MGGKSKTTEETKTQTTQEQEQQAFATPEEQAELDRQQGIIGSRAEGTQASFENAINLINQALTGGSLPGFLGALPGGISPDTIGTEAARVAGQAQPGFQSLGIADSGVAFRETAREVGESVLFPAEAFNIQNLFNIAQLGLGGQSAVESQQQAREGNLGGRLAGLRRITGSGSGTTNQFTTSKVPNPFTQALATSAGQSLGQQAGNIFSGGSEKGSEAFKAIFAGGA